MALTAPLDTIIKFALFLIVAFVLIFGVRSLGYDPVSAFMSVFSLGERCQGHTSRDYERLINGYAAKSEAIEQFQLCDRYKRCFSEQFALFEQKNREKNRPLCQVTP